MNSATLYIPVEQGIRDLYPKVLLSVFAAASGFRVVLGQRKRLERAILHFEPGIYLDRGLTGNHETEARIANLASNGFLVTSLEVEPLGAFSYPRLFSLLRYSQKNLDNVSRVFTWSETERRVIEGQFAVASSKLVVTGSPRLDILRESFRHVFERHAERIRRKHGRFILVNLNARFFHINGPSAERRVEQERAAWILNNGGSQEDVSSWFGRRSALRERNSRMLGDVIALANRNPTCAFVIRPHPTENVEALRNSWLVPDNCAVIRDGSVIPWLMAAQTMVHAYCTTAVEAAMLGRPAVCYDPFTTSYDWLPERAVSRLCTDSRQLEQLTCANDIRESCSLEASSILGREFGGLVESSTASQNVVNQIRALVEELGDSRYGFQQPTSDTQSPSEGLIGQFLTVLLSLRGGGYSLNSRSIRRLVEKFKLPITDRANVRSIARGIVEVGATRDALSR